MTACDDLQNGNLKDFGIKMTATHEGLRTLYQVSCKELDFLVDAVWHESAVLGSRMMGGGFGGCTINLVKEDAIEKLVADISKAYSDETKLPLTAYIASIEDGTSICQT